MRKCGISNWPSGKNENIGNQMTSKQWELQKTATQATTSHHLSVTLALNNEQRSWWPQKQNFKTCFEECCVSWIGRFNDQGSRINWEHARLVSRLWPLFFMTEVLDCKPFLRLEPIVFDDRDAGPNARNSNAQQQETQWFCFQDLQLCWKVLATLTHTNLLFAWHSNCAFSHIHVAILFNCICLECVLLLSWFFIVDPAVSWEAKNPPDFSGMRCAPWS